MGKLLDKYGTKSGNIAPTGKERPAGDPKTVTAMTVSANRLRERAEAAEAEAERLQQELAAAKESGGTLEVRIADLHEVAGRKRKLTHEQFSELVENLRNNPLVTPITVRTRPAGGYEIISGHNRAEAYRQLGRDQIATWVLESDEEQADLNAFYANLLQPSLPEYEKYQGFKKRLELTGKTQAEIAQEAGVTAPYVSMLMVFDDLPMEIRERLDARPDLIGTNAARDFAALTKAGRLAQALKALDEIASGASQAAAIRAAYQDETPAKQKSEARKFRIGKSTFAEMRAVDKTLRISFRSPEEREVLEKGIADLIAAYTESEKAKGL